MVCYSKIEACEDERMHKIYKYIGVLSTYYYNNTYTHERHIIANTFNFCGSSVQPIDYHTAHNTGYSMQPIAIRCTGRHFILLV